MVIFFLCPLLESIERNVVEETMILWQGLCIPFVCASASLTHEFHVNHVIGVSQHILNSLCNAVVQKIRANALLDDVVDGILCFLISATGILRFRWWDARAIKILPHQ